MTAPDLHQIGAALYGPSWQTPLAHALGVNIRTAQRWAAGTHAVPGSAWADIHALAIQRRGEIDEIVVELGKQIEK